MLVSAKVVTNFWRHVDQSDGPDACWDWTGSLNNSYGSFNAEGKTVRAHRFALMLKLGREPIGDTRHLCHNRKCCNPSHLKEGTRLENIRDSVLAGRTAKGVRNGRAKLDESKVSVIKQMLRHGCTQEKIAICYGVTSSVIHKISTGKNWKHIS